MRIMGILLAAVVVIMLNSAGSAQDKKAVDDDNKKIEGTWTVVSIEPTAKTKEDLARMKIMIKDGSIIIKDGDVLVEKQTFKLDPSKKPKQIDIKAEDERLPGIYELDGDNLKLCVTEGKGTPRPTKFAPDDKTEAVLVVLKRQK